MPPGTYVSLKGALVTAKSSTGFFVQVKPGDPGDMGSDNSGLFVYQPNAPLSVGDRVSIQGAWVDEFYGQVQLSNPQTKVDSTSGESPTPVSVSAPDVATCGARAKRR